MLDSSYSRYIEYNQESRWASEEEIKQSSQKIDLTADNFPGAGLPLLVEGTTANVDNSDTHTIVFGSTGSKKTRLFCMPMLNIFARAGESFIATDPKGELYAKTSGHIKAMGYKTIVLNFRDIGLGDMWNPLALPYELYHNGKRDAAVSMVNDFITALDTPNSYGKNDVFWSNMACALGLANLLLLIENSSANECNVGSFAKLSSVAHQSKIIDIAKLINEDSLIGINYKGVLLEEAASTRDCIFSSLFAMIRIFIMQENLTKMLSGTTFDIRTIGKEKTAVYIIVPDEKTTYHFLVATFIKQAYEVLINEAQSEKEFKLPVRVNFVLDEFCNMPCIPDMPSMISAARSRNMRFYLVAQSLHQLKGKYGEDADTIKGNCDNWVFITSKELDLLNEISELCGNRRTAYGKKRNLVSTSELQRFDKELGEVLIMHCRQYPIVVELPDINDYKMFDGYDVAPMKPFELSDIMNINIGSLLNQVKLAARNDINLDELQMILGESDEKSLFFENEIIIPCDDYDELQINSWRDVSEISFVLNSDNSMDVEDICLINALLGIILINCSKKERTMISLHRILAKMEVRCDDEYKDPVDNYVEEQKEKNKDELRSSICNYECYKRANYLKRKSALQNCKRKVAEYIKACA